MCVVRACVFMYVKCFYTNHEATLLRSKECARNRAGVVKEMIPDAWQGIAREVACPYGEEGVIFGPETS